MTAKPIFIRNFFISEIPLEVSLLFNFLRSNLLSILIFSKCYWIQNINLRSTISFSRDSPTNLDISMIRKTAITIFETSKCSSHKTTGTTNSSKLILKKKTEKFIKLINDHFNTGCNSIINIWFKKKSPK